jgi:hypothetical protein
MLQDREMLAAVLENGKVEGHELARLKEALYRDGGIDRRKADLLVELHKRVERVTPAFEDFFHKAVKDHVLRDGRISAADVAWLRQSIFTDGKTDDRGRKLLRELRGEAQLAGAEFQALCDECLG